MRAPGIIRFLLLCALSLGAAAGIVQLSGTAFAARSSDGRGVEAFSRAVKAYEDGDWSAASKHVNDAIQAGLSKELTARAIHLRAHVDEHSGSLARALQDYSTALWMGTLPQRERKVAQEGKQRVIAAMGLSSPESGSAKVSTEAPKPAPKSSSGSAWGMFDIFGSSKPAAAAPPPPPAPSPASAAAPARTAGPAKPRARTSASAVIRRRKPAEARFARTAPAEREVRAASPQPPASVRIASLQSAATPVSNYSDAGGYMILFGSMRSESAGRSMARKIKASLSDILVGRDLEVEAGAAGSYEIVAGPYKMKSSALAVCSVIKRRGVRCHVTP
jgi:hypothetical protein